ncbi:MAG: hypothetical protein ABFE07_07345, partial [Armatimonadia bacterium]
DAAMLEEAKGGPSSTKAKQARDTKAHAVEVGQVGLMAAQGELAEAQQADDSAREDALRGEYAGIVAQLEKHPVLAAIDAMLEAMADFEALQVKAREVVHQYNQIRDKDGSERMHHNRRSLSLGGEKLRLLLLIGRNGRDQVGPVLEIN